MYLMAFLKMKFIKGYNGENTILNYGRNGNIISKKIVGFTDASIHNNLGEEINNEIITKKKYGIKISKQNPIYIKSNIINRQIKKVDIGTGDEPNNIIDTKIEKISTLSYKKKPKPFNKVTKSSFRINKSVKNVKEQGTSMPHVINKIVK